MSGFGLTVWQRLIETTVCTTTKAFELRAAIGPVQGEAHKRERGGKHLAIASGCPTDTMEAKSFVCLAPSTFTPTHHHTAQNTNQRKQTGQNSHKPQRTEYPGMT